MRYNIISPSVRARHCRAPTGVPHINEKRYKERELNKMQNFILYLASLSFIRRWIEAEVSQGHKLYDYLILTPKRKQPF
jgi:hypothetical protein